MEHITILIKRIRISLVHRNCLTSFHSVMQRRGGRQSCALITLSQDDTSTDITNITSSFSHVCHVCTRFVNELCCGFKAGCRCLTIPDERHRSRISKVTLKGPTSVNRTRSARINVSSPDRRQKTRRRRMLSYMFGQRSRIVR